MKFTGAVIPDASGTKNGGEPPKNDPIDGYVGGIHCA